MTIRKYHLFLLHIINTILRFGRFTARIFSYTYISASLLLGWLERLPFLLLEIILLSCQPLYFPLLPHKSLPRRFPSLIIMKAPKLLIITFFSSGLLTIAIVPGPPAASSSAAASTALSNNTAYKGYSFSDECLQ